MRKLMLMIVIGLVVLTAVGAEPPDLVGTWTMTMHFINGQRWPLPLPDKLVFFENGTGLKGPAEMPFLWKWVNDEEFIFTQIFGATQIKISRLTADTFLYLRVDPPAPENEIGILKKESRQ